MKRGIWILVLAAIPGFVRAEEGGPWANKIFLGRGDIDPIPLMVEHDFGNQPAGTRLTYRFEVTNIYNVPIEITSKPEVSCGCTRVVDYTAKLEPKQRGYLEVEMDASRFVGAKAVTVRVPFISGNQYASTAILQVKAFARADVMLKPGTVNFGLVQAGQNPPPSQTIQVHYTGAIPNWQITGLELEGDANFTAVQKTFSRTAQGVVSQVTATIKPDAAAGPFQQEMILKTNDPTTPVISVTVSGNIQAALSVSPSSQLRFDPIEIGKEATRNITVRGEKPFKIVSIDGQGDGLTAELNNRPAGKVQGVTLRFAPQKTGEVKKQLTIHTDSKETVTITIRAGTSAEEP